MYVFIYIYRLFLYLHYICWILYIRNIRYTFFQIVIIIYIYISFILHNVNIPIYLQMTFKYVLNSCSCFFYFFKIVNTVFKMYFLYFIYYVSYLNIYIYIYTFKSSVLYMCIYMFFVYTKIIGVTLSVLFCILMVFVVDTN